MSKRHKNRQKKNQKKDLKDKKPLSAEYKKAMRGDRSKEKQHSIDLSCESFDYEI